MKKMGIEALYRKPRLSKPNSDHKFYPYLLRGLEISRANQVWAADITYIPMAKGLAIMDWRSRRVLSWRLSNTLDTMFCTEALEEALERFGKSKRKWHGILTPVKPSPTLSGLNLLMTSKIHSL